MRRSLLGLAALTATAAPLAAFDLEPAYGPDDLRVGGELLSKQLENGRPLVDDTVFHAIGTARYFGVGLTLDAWFAASVDKTSQARTVNPGETTEVNAKLDYLFEYRDEADIPIFQIIPKLTWTFYPNQPESDYRDNQLWLGLDAWYMLPWEGIEVGAGVEWNTPSGHHYVRGGLGARQFFQQFAPFDLHLWQAINFGNGKLRDVLIGDNDPGLTYLDIGAKVTYPLPYQELWTYVKADIQWWVRGEDRKDLRAMGADSGNFVIGVGVEWIAE